jgi:hypothetical protein
MTRRSRLHDAWIVAAITFLTITLAAGILCFLAAGMGIRIGRESRSELLAPQPTGRVKVEPA